MIRWFKRRRRRKLASTAFPAAWLEVLCQRFPIYQSLCEADREALKSKIQVFVAEKRFEGCGGLVMTDEIRVLIAAQACLLLLHRSEDGYEELRSILVYPSSYFAESAQHVSGGVIQEQRTKRLGESWQHGTVVLAWDAVLGDAANPFDGHNVVFHEFAHQLDQEDGRADGAPVLGKGLAIKERYAIYSSWTKVLTEKFEQLQQRTRKGRKTLLDSYGATHPAEFFAVATECFFEKPKVLLKKHPRLYEELRRFYRQHPAE